MEYVAKTPSSDPSGHLLPAVEKRENAELSLIPSTFLHVVPTGSAICLSDAQTSCSLFSPAGRRWPEGSDEGAWFKRITFSNSPYERSQYRSEEYHRAGIFAFQVRQGSSQGLLFAPGLFHDSKIGGLNIQPGLATRSESCQTDCLRDEIRRSRQSAVLPGIENRRYRPPGEPVVQICIRSNADFAGYSKVDILPRFLFVAVCGPVQSCRAVSF
ncbi:hypothetical protein AMK06_CH03288 [Rhizobium sp. N541]|nr:hypothetical protein AMK05_CH03329 [Rhizobium sp. N324]ANM18164.1 hypothetical protein AMK06_CH03288 [Rhizobium sp. N541]ANM24550.1 hypothetical protein AMK07_CH03286 [Rhizobium sp. N941]OYD05294.1 hypothetical protein AMK08_CH103348 [Rhizobium sp. N4311]